MTWDRNAFQTYTPITGQNIELPKQQSIPILGYSKLEIPCHVDGHNYAVTISSAVHAPDLHHQLFSEPQATTHGLQVVKKNETCLISHGPKTILTATCHPSHGNLYIVKDALKPQPPSSATVLSAINFFNLKEKFQSLPRSNMGLWCEIVTRLSLELEVPTYEQTELCLEPESWLDWLITTFNKYEIVNQTIVSKKNMFLKAASNMVLKMVLSTTNVPLFIQ
jgi:hypothetical protein